MPHPAGHAQRNRIWAEGNTRKIIRAIKILVVLELHDKISSKFI